MSSTEFEKAQDQVTQLNILLIQDLGDVKKRTIAALFLFNGGGLTVILNYIHGENFLHPCLVYLSLTSFIIGVVFWLFLIVLDQVSMDYYTNKYLSLNGKFYAEEITLPDYIPQRDTLLKTKLKIKTLQNIIGLVSLITGILGAIVGIIGFFNN
jgi:hypothetical protein